MTRCTQCGAFAKLIKASCERILNPHEPNFVLVDVWTGIDCKKCGHEEFIEDLTALT